MPARDGRRARHPAVEWLFWAGPPLFLMAFIFWLGSDRAAVGETRSLLGLLLQKLAPALYHRLSPEEIAGLNVVIRKAGHFLGYALLGILNTRALRGLRRTTTGGTLASAAEEREGPAALRRDAVRAWLAAVAWAGIDEFHQSFAASRGASAGDVLLDAAGALAGILLYLLYLRWKRTIRRS